MKRLTKRNAYIEIVFPIYLFLNLMTMTTFCYTPIGESSSLVVLIVKACRYLIYLISIVKFASSHFKNKQLMIAAIVSGTFFVSLVFTRDTEYFCYIIVFIALIGESGVKIINKHFKITAVFVPCMIMLSQVGIVEDYITPDLRARHFLGFNWTTYPAVLLVFLLLEYIYLHEGKVRFLHLIVFDLAGFWIYKKTDSKFAFAVLAFVSVFFFLVRTYKPIKHKRVYRGLLLTPWICTGISFIVAKTYSPGNRIMFAINSLLSQRLRLMHSALETFPLKIIGGQPIEWQGFSRDFTTFEGYNYVDNSYIQLMLQYGVFLLVIVLTFYTIGILTGIKEKKAYICWILVAICLHGLVEPYLLRFTFNPFVWLGVELIKPYLPNQSRIGFYMKRTSSRL